MFLLSAATVRSRRRPGRRCAGGRTAGGRSPGRVVPRSTRPPSSLGGRSHYRCGQVRDNWTYGSLNRMIG